MHSSEFTVAIDDIQSLHYTVAHPSGLLKPEVWMRSVDRDLRGRSVSRKRRFDLFTMSAWDEKIFNRRLKRKERSYTSHHRVSFRVTTIQGKYILARDAYKRVRNAGRRTAKRYKIAVENANRQTAPLICYGLMKTEAKYDQFRRLNNAITQGKHCYGVRLPQQPSVEVGKTNVYKTYCEH
jgi:hypothetical protein